MVDDPASGNVNFSREFGTNNYGNRSATYNNSTVNNTYADATHPQRSGIETLAEHIAPTALHSSDARNARTACLKGTRVGIVKKLTGWVEDPSKKRRVCWVTGGAGAGKSAIAQTICETFRRKSQLAASFFFSRNDTSRSTLDPFFPTLAHQLATTPEFQTTRLSSFIASTVRQTPNVLQGMNLEGQFQSLIFQPCAQIDVKKWKTLPKLIVIDGLDECMGGSGTTSASHTQEALLSIINNASHAQEALLSIIHNATSASPPIPFQFMIFSRPEPTIRNFFQTTLSHEYVDTRDFNEEANRDIRAYLKKEFATLSDSRPEILARGVWPGEEATNQLVRKADGHFIYVVTVMKYITSNNPSPAELRERLNIVLHTERTTSHPDLSDLDQLYHTILRRFGNGDLHTRLLLPLLQVVITPFKEAGAHATRAFDNHRSQNLIAILLKIDLRQCSALLSLLRSVLHIPDDPHNADVSVLHATFSDFLGDGHRSREFQVQLLHKSAYLDHFWCCLLFVLERQLHQHQRHEQIEHEDWRPKLISLNCWFYGIEGHFHFEYTPSEELLSAVVNFDLYGYSNMILDRFVLVPLELFDIGITYAPSKWAKKTFRECQSVDWKEYLFPYDE
ncbi:hypothetical protein PM082_014538 [Marasmius tenuissimus]|nr:hypothetical protein PM082_014538 [Marasmius tenuissimus]